MSEADSMFHILFECSHTASRECRQMWQDRINTLMASQLERAKDISKNHNYKLAELYQVLLHMFREHPERELLWRAIWTPSTMDYLEEQLGCNIQAHWATTAGRRCLASATRTFTSMALQGSQELLRTRYYVGRQISFRLAKEQLTDTQHIPRIPHAAPSQAPGESPLPSAELNVLIHRLLNQNRNGSDIRERTDRFNARRAKQSYESWLTAEATAGRI